jgi:hypothetical protein
MQNGKPAAQGSKMREGGTCMEVEELDNGMLRRRYVHMRNRVWY